MFVVYLVYSIAGWVAFALLMAFWAGYVVGGRRATAQARRFDMITATAPPTRPEHDSAANSAAADSATGTAPKS